MAQDPALVMPINLVFTNKDRVVAFVQQAYAGSAMYQIVEGHIATIVDDNKMPKTIIQGWKFLFEHDLEITTKGITDPHASFHVNVLLAKKPEDIRKKQKITTTAFPKFPIHKVFSCGKDDGITNLLITLLSINGGFTDLHKELQKYPENFQYISVLGFHHAHTLTQNSSKIGTSESESEYAEHLQRKIEEQKTGKNEPKRSRQDLSLGPDPSLGGNKKKHKKSKRKPLSKKKRTVKFYQKK